MSPVSAASDLRDQRDVAVEDAGLDHAVAANLQREVLALPKQVGRHVDDMAPGLDRLDRRAGGNSAHDRNGNRTTAIILRGGAHTPEIAFDHARREATRAGRPSPCPTESGS